MNKYIKLVFLSLLIIIFSWRLLYILDSIFFQHIDVDSDIIEVTDNNLFFLDQYEEQLFLRSIDHSDLAVLCLNIGSDYSFKKNGNLYSQNYNRLSRNYNYNDFLVINISEKDYLKEDVCEIKFQLGENEKREDMVFIVGHRNEIDKFINQLNTLKVVVYALLISGIIIACIAMVKEKNFESFLIIATLIYIVATGSTNYNLLFISLSLIGMGNAKGGLGRLGIYISYIIALVVPFVFITPVLLIIILYRNFIVHSNKGKIGLVNHLLLVLYLSYFQFSSPDMTIFTEIFYFLIVCIHFLSYSIAFILDNMSNTNSEISTTLLRGVSHDFKIPLSVIKLNQEYTNNVLITELERNKYNKSTDKAVRDLEKMLSTLTAFISKKNYVNNHYNSSVLESLNKAKSNFENYNSSIKFIANYSVEDSYVGIDPIWLDRLLNNLIENAMKYSNPEHGVIEVIYRKNKANLKIIVKDNGIGIETKNLSKIFEPFYRVDAARHISGLGLGLSVINDIVHRMDGDITVASTVDIGTTFTVVLPFNT